MAVLKNMLKVGDKVSFGKPGQGKKTGTVTKVNQKTANVKVLKDGEYRVTFNLITKVGPKKTRRNPAPKRKTPRKKNPPSYTRRPRLGGRYQAMVEREDDWRPHRGGSMAFAETEEAPTMPRPRRAPRGSSPPSRRPRRPQQNPPGLTKKGERMYEHIKRGYEEAGNPRAKEIAARTVLKASKTIPGLKRKR